MKLDLTSVKKFETYLATMGLAHYGIERAKRDVETADEMDLFDNKMQKTRILERIKSLENNL